jgi:ATP-dependent RNA helicase RhlE
MSFAALGLAPALLRAVKDAGYLTPTPIQTQAIPLLLQGRDLLACAQTGTGKTAAFGLPLLQQLLQRQDGLRVLILVPTRELAVQIHTSLRVYGRYTTVRLGVVYGGVKIGPQTLELRAGLDILVATPGRLLDHLERGTVDFAALECLILDEADRMLDMGFIHDVRRILHAIPAQRQTLFFSATLPYDVQCLAAEMLQEPVRIEITPPATTPPTIRQVIHPVDRAQKTNLLLHLLTTRRMEHVLVFTRTKDRADRLARHLSRQGHMTAALHGDKPQGVRTRVLNGFRTRQVHILIATDLAARGLDVEGVSHVVNFDLPSVAEDYVHRVGRTGRAETPGHAVSLMDAGEWEAVCGIERLTGVAIPREVVPGFEPSRQELHGPTVPRRGTVRRWAPSHRAGRQRSSPRRRIL